MPPRSCIVDSATEFTPTVDGANSRAATTQYRSPTAEVSAELSTSARPSRATGLILNRDRHTDRPLRPAGGTTFSSTRTPPDYPGRSVRPPRPGGSIAPCPRLPQVPTP